MTTAAAARYRLRWWVAKGDVIPPGAPHGWQLLLDELVADGLADRRDDGSLTPRTNPRAARYTADAAAAIAAAMRMILVTLEAEGETPATRWFPLGAAIGISRDHVDIAHGWLVTDGLIVTHDHHVTRPAQPITWVKPKLAPVPAAKPAPVPPEPPPAPAQAPESPPAAKPAPVAKPAPPAAPPPAPSPADELLALQRRATFAAEVSAGLVAAPQRVRTPLGSSPLLDTQLRLCVVFAAAGRPLTVHDLTQRWLSKSQIAFLKPALADGVRRGGFTAAGAVGRYGSRYTLTDPTVFDATWESVNAHAATVRRRRDARPA